MLFPTLSLASESPFTLWRDFDTHPIYNIRFSAQDVSFQDQVKKYADRVYRSESTGINLGVDLFPLTYGARFGLGFDVGGYKDTGYALDENLTHQVRSDRVELTLIPMQVSAKVEWSPFRDEWVKISGWHGREWLYVEENRINTATNPEEGKSQSYVSKGTNYARVSGISLSFNISELDQKSKQSLRSMGIHQVYLRPYYLSTKTLKAKAGAFDRTVYGLGFSFQTI